MKKYNLLKVLGIAFAITLLLSWIISAGNYSSGAFTSLDSTMPVGLYDIVKMPAIAIATFVQYGVVFLAIGAFYGVLNKIGIFGKIVNDATKHWKKREKTFLLITIFSFALFSTLFSIQTLSFVFVPLFVAILLSMKYDKMTAFAATIGAILIGQIGAVLGFNLWGYFVIFFNLKMTSLILVRIILFLISTGLFAFIVTKHSEIKAKKKTTKKTKGKKEGTKDEKIVDEKIEIPLYEEHKTKRNKASFILVMILMTVLLILGMYNWYYAFDISVFNDLHTGIQSNKIITGILGSVQALGSWRDFDLAIVLIFTSVLIGWIYSLKFSDILDGIKEGMKKIAPTALYAMLASTVFITILNMQEGNFVATIFDKTLGMTDGFNFVTTTLSSIVASFYYNDFYTLLSNFYGAFSSYDAEVLPTVAFIMQSIYGLVMVIAPTSIFLLAGLKYMDISYKDWAKYIWKFLVIMLIVIMLIALILTLI